MQVLEVQKALNHPEATADYADRIRRALENAVVDQNPEPVALKPDNVAELISLARQMDPKVLQRLITMAKLSGLNETSAARLARAVSTAPHLNSTHVQKLETAIQENAPSADDLNKLAAHLESSDGLKSNQPNGAASWDDAADDNLTTSELLKGSAWILKNDGKDKSETETERTSRGLGLKIVDPTLFPNVELYSAKRYCGVLPKFQTSRHSNAPGQYPWSVCTFSIQKAVIL